MNARRPPTPSSNQIEAIRRAVNPQRLLDTAIALVEVPSPTRSAGAVADRLAEILANDGFSVDRPVADWPDAPAVVVRLDTGRPGHTLQFDGHLDTVHLPFVPPRFENGLLYGSGASDMKGGVAAAVEALRALRETGLLSAGAVLLTAHDHHEGPWGDRRQVRALIEAGVVGDAVLLPEYMATTLPLAGRGMVIFEVRLKRGGEAMHEVVRPPDLPDVLGAGAALVQRLQGLHTDTLVHNTSPHVGSDSLFIGSVHCGEMYNQAATECVLSGTRRWVTPNAGPSVLAELDALFAEVAEAYGVQVERSFEVQGEAYAVDETAVVVQALQNAHAAISGEALPIGGKPFVDDGNTFAGLAGIPALTHGPQAKGAHTLHEEVALTELVRVAQVYALAAVTYCAK